MSKKPNAYLKARGKNKYYSAVVSIPEELRKYYPRGTGGLKDKEIIALHTNEISKARALRDRYVANLFLEFEELRTSSKSVRPTLTETIEEQLKAIDEADSMGEQSRKTLLEEGLAAIRDHHRDNPSLYELDDDNVRLARAKHKAFKTTSISFILEEYLKDRHAFSPSMSQKMRRYCRELIDFVGRDIQPEKLSLTQAREFIRHINQQTERGLKVKKDTAGGLGKLWSWAKRHEYVRDNVFEGAREDIYADKRGTAKPRHPFTDQEVVDVLDGLHGLNKEQQALPSLTLLGLFTGMRVSELANLRVEHILEGNILDIVAGKNSEAVRRIPTHKTVHPLIEHLIQSSEDGWLIPCIPEGKTKRGAYASSLFSSYKQELWGVNARPKLTFHSFRHRIEDLIRDVKGSPPIGRALSGRKGTHSEDDYGHGVTLKYMQELINSLQQGQKVDDAVAKLLNEVLAGYTTN